MKQRRTLDKIFIVFLVLALIGLLCIFTYAAIPPEGIGNSLLQLGIAVLLSIAVSIGAMKLAKGLDQKKNTLAINTLAIKDSNAAKNIAQPAPLSRAVPAPAGLKRFAVPAFAGAVLIVAVCVLYATRRDAWLNAFLLQSVLAIGGAVAFGLGCLKLHASGRAPIPRAVQNRVTGLVTLLAQYKNRILALPSAVRRPQNGWALSVVSPLAVLAAFALVASALSQPVFRDQNAFSALIYAEGTVSQSRDLFLAPTQQLQDDYFSRYSSPKRNAVKALVTHKSDLPPETMNTAALVSFASEDYGLADEFVRAALDKGAHDNPSFLNTLGLINLKRGLYKESLANFQEALTNLPSTERAEGFKAALITNKAIAEWKLGNDKDAEKSLGDSLALLTKEARPRTYVELLDTKLQIETDDVPHFDALYKDALESAKGSPSEEGQLYRQYAELMFLRGETAKSEELIRQAIELHKPLASPLQLAKDLDQAGEIKLDFRSPQDALVDLAEAAGYYKQLGYREGIAGNNLLQARALIDLGDFESAQRMIDEADRLLRELGCKMGLAQAALLSGQAKFRQALGPEFDPRLLDAAEGLYKTAQATFQEIGFKRGVADVTKSFCTLETERSRHSFSPEGFSKAEKICQQGIALYAEIGSKRGVADSQANLGILYHETGKLDLADHALQEALKSDKDIQYRLGIARQYGNLGRLEITKGDKVSAIGDFKESCALFKDLQAKADLPRCERSLKCVKESKELKECDSSARAHVAASARRRGGSASRWRRQSLFDLVF